MTKSRSKSKKSLFKIFLEDEFLGCVPGILLLEQAIDVYDESSELHFDSLTSTQIESIVEWVTTSAKRKLVDYLAKMERSVFDCRAYLRRQDVPSAIMDKVIAEAIKHKWLSDKRYAELYAEYALQNLMSPMDVRYKLIQKKIDKATIEKAINDVFSKDTVGDILDELIDKLLRRYADVNGRQKFDKIATALYRKGFEYGEYESRLKEKIANIE